MKLRIKFSKAGSMKFISHLDLMRYVQKALRRAGIDVAYSQGFHPHPLLSFAAPLGLGDTSEGDYLDLQVNSMPEKAEFLRRINAQMNEEIRFLSVQVQAEKSKPSMALVAAADYCVNIRDGYAVPMETFPEFMAQKEIFVLKKSKRTKTEVDILPMIYVFAQTEQEFHEKQECMGEPICPMQTIFEEGQTPVCYLRTACGSSLNLKPDLVMEAFCHWNNIEYQPFAFQIHRLETYTEYEQPPHGVRIVMAAKACQGCTSRRDDTFISGEGQTRKLAALKDFMLQETGNPSGGQKNV